MGLPAHSFRGSLKSRRIRRNSERLQLEAISFLSNPGQIFKCASLLLLHPRFLQKHFAIENMCLAFGVRESNLPQEARGIAYRMLVLDLLRGTFENDGWVDCVWVCLFSYKRFLLFSHVLRFLFSWILFVFHVIHVFSFHFPCSLPRRPVKRPPLYMDFGRLFLGLPRLKSTCALAPRRAPQGESSITASRYSAG